MKENNRDVDILLMNNGSIRVFTAQDKSHLPSPSIIK